MRQITARDMDRPPGRPPLYPWRTMEIGDSFFVPNKTPRTMHKSTRGYRPMKFRCRSVVCRGVEGTRVWRIA